MDNDAKATGTDEVPPVFELGHVRITTNAARTLSKEDVGRALLRHRSGDWGMLGEFDWTSNEEALETGSRLFSVYPACGGTGLF